MIRRDFIKLAGLSFSGLVFGQPVHASVQEKDLEIVPFFSLSSEGEVQVFVPKSEMGQGIHTSLATILLEELNMSVKNATVYPAMAEYRYGVMLTGGSLSIVTCWTKFSRIGAQIRELFLEAVSVYKRVPKGECRLQNGVAYARDEAVSFKELIPILKELPLPGSAKPKPEKEHQFIGKRIARSDTLAKITGAPIFGIDVRVENQVFASLIRPPDYQAKLLSWKAPENLPEDILKIVKIKNKLAVLSTSIQSAMEYRSQVEVKWSELDESASISNKSLHEKLRQTAKEDYGVAQSLGEGSDPKQENFFADYFLPYQAHATLEVQNCTVKATRRQVEIWAPCQVPLWAKKTVQDYMGLTTDSVKFHVTFLGGGFGRRLERDYIMEALEVALQWDGPVQLIWDREEDMKNDAFRPCSLHRMGAKVEKDEVLSFSHHLVAPSILSSKFGTGSTVALGFDPSALEGGWKFPYNFKNQEVRYSDFPTNIPVGWWRSVFDSQNAFAKECFIDELAIQCDKDPAEFRLQNLPDSSREAGVLREMQRKIYSQELLANPIGLAVHKSFGSYIGAICELRNRRDGIKIHKYHIFVDCGRFVNPDTIEAQAQGSVVWGLSSVKSGIEIEKDRILNTNFHDYPVLQMGEMPEVEVHILDTKEDPGGIGEPVVPVIAPALMNAYARLTHQRVRELPFWPFVI